MPQTHLLYGLNIDEVSSVDKGAGEGVQILLMKRFSTENTETTDYVKRSFDAAQRRKDASSGVAMRDGSFPIENKKDLKNAIHLSGHSDNPAEARAHIRSRAKAIGAEDLLPDEWSAKRLTITHSAGGDVKIVHKPEPGEKTTDTGVEKMDTFTSRWLEKIGIAKAAYFPSIQLTGTAGVESAELKDIFNWENRIWSIGPSISLPLFEGGRNRAGVQRAQAAYQEAVAQYRSQILTAFRDV